MKAIICNKIFDGDRILENHSVVCDGGLIHSVVDSRQLPTSYDIERHSSGMLVPGFIDLQVNGGGGDLFNDDQSVAAIQRIGSAHRQFGTTGFMPTLISDTDEKMQLSRDAVAKAITDDVAGVMGIHFEGPYLNQTKRGAHSANRVRPIQRNDVKFLVADFPGVTLLTIAPECTDPNIIETLCAAGVKISIGHSNATFEQTKDAVRAGASGFTHLFNAMSGLSAREPGVIGAALDCKTSWCAMIVDGIHVHPATLKVALATKPRGKCFLVTDSMPTVGSEKDTFLFFGERLRVRDNLIINQEGVLSGSHLNMAQAVRNAVDLLDVSIEEAIRMASLYPAEFLGMSDRMGRLRAGYSADLVLLDDDGRVIKSWQRGQPPVEFGDDGVPFG